MLDAHMSSDCVEAQRGNDAKQNEDVIDKPHWRLECSSPSSTGELCDEGSYAPSTQAFAFVLLLSCIVTDIISSES